MVLKSNKEKILNIFFDYTEEGFGLKKLSNKTNLAHTSTKRELEELIKLKYVKVRNEVIGKRNFPVYFANLNEKTIFLKKIYNEKKIVESGIVEFLVKKLLPNSIILFGSFSRGEDKKSSDIDLFVESEFRELNLTNYERKLKRKINILFKKNINGLKKEIRNNIINGRILYGAVEIEENEG